MNPRLENHLQKFSPATGYEDFLDDLRQEMEDAIPEITDSIRQREELAAEMRITASTRSQSKKENQD